MLHGVLPGMLKLTLMQRKRLALHYIVVEKKTYLHYTTLSVERIWKHLPVEGWTIKNSTFYHVSFPMCSEGVSIKDTHSSTKYCSSESVPGSNWTTHSTPVISCRLLRAKYCSLGDSMLMILSQTLEAILVLRSLFGP